MEADYIGQAEARMRALRAVTENNLKFFIKDYLLFRAQIRFKQSTGKSNITRPHRFGNEHSCTLNQVRAGHVDSVVLNRAKGLTDLFKMIEVDYKGKIYGATVYMRETKGEKFNKIIRIYDENKIREDHIPEMIPRDFELFYAGMDNGLPVFTEERLPCFKTELSTQLSNV